PGSDDAAAPPVFADRLQVEVILVVLRLAQRRDLGAGGGAAGLADAGVLEDVQALGVGGHDAVLHAVVDHLDAVAGARRSAVQVPPRRRARGRLVPALDPLAAGVSPLDLLDLRGRDAAVARGDGLEDRAEALDGRLVAADHQAVAADQAPDAAG